MRVSWRWEGFGACATLIDLCNLSPPPPHPVEIVPLMTVLTVVEMQIALPLSPVTCEGHVTLGHAHIGASCHWLRAIARRNILHTDTVRTKYVTDRGKVRRTICEMRAPSIVISIVEMLTSSAINVHVTVIEASCECFMTHTDLWLHSDTVSVIQYKLFVTCTTHVQLSLFLSQRVSDPRHSSAQNLVKWPCSCTSVSPY